ncbi:MAG: hypothetical protein WCL02_01685 [bacterium]
MSNKNKKKILIFDAGYISHKGYYKALEQYYDVDYCLSLGKFLTLSLMSDFHYDIVIIYPYMYSGDNFKGIPDSQTGQAVYRKFFQDKKHHTKVIVWAHSIEESLEHWGDNVVQRKVIPRYSHFDFLPVVHGIMSKKKQK